MQGSKLKVLFYISFFCLIQFSNEIHAQEEDDSTELEEFISFLSMNDRLPKGNEKQIDDIITYSKNFIGTPYHYGGISPSGFDCSGFIYYVMGNFGMSLTHSSYGLAEFGENVLLSEVRAGDLLFFKGRNVNSTGIGHVALVINHDEEGIRFIHSSTSRGVVIDNFNKSKYYIPRYIKAKRLDFGVAEPENLMLDDSMDEE